MNETPELAVPEPSAAARSFASIPELIMHVVDYVDEDDLANTRQVNMASCEVATKRMFYSFRVHNAEYPGMELDDLVKEPLINDRILRHVRVLYVNAYSRDLIETTTGHLVAEKLLPFMPRLKAFHWSEGFIPDVVISALSKLCPELTILDIKYQRGTRETPKDKLVTGYTMPRFSVLRNLESLTLRYFNGPNLVAWCDELVQLFKNNSATLKHLHLCTSPILNQLPPDEGETAPLAASMRELWTKLDAFHPINDQVHRVHSWHDRTLAYIFHTYASVGGEPLRLEHLNLGWTTSWRFQREALAKFVHLHHLKEIALGITAAHWYPELENHPFFDFLRRLSQLKIQGGDVQPVVQEFADAMENTYCALWAINCINCPNLRAIVAIFTTHTIQSMLITSGWVKPEWLRQLAVATNLRSLQWTDHVRRSECLHILSLPPRAQNGRYSNVLNGPVHLRMSNLQCGPSSLHRFRQSELSSTGETINSSPAQEPEQNLSFDRKLEWMVNSDTGIIEGLFLGIEARRIRAGVPFKALHVIGRQLAKLQKLSQLLIQLEESPTGDANAEERERMRSEVKWFVGICGNNPKFVLPFVMYSRSIEYVKVAETAWRVVRDSAGEVQLKKLRRHEEDAVELFRLYARVDDCTWG